MQQPKQFYLEFKWSAPLDPIMTTSNLLAVASDESDSAGLHKSWRLDTVLADGGAFNGDECIEDMRRNQAEKERKQLEKLARAQQCEGRRNAKKREHEDKKKRQEGRKRSTEEKRKKHDGAWEKRRRQSDKVRHNVPVTTARGQAQSLGP